MSPAWRHREQSSCLKVSTRKFVVRFAPPERCFLAQRLGGARSATNGRKDMRELWVTVGAMVLGYIMYLGIKSIGKK